MWRAWLGHGTAGPAARTGPAAQRFLPSLHLHCHCAVLGWHRTLGPMASKGSSHQARTWTPASTPHSICSGLTRETWPSA